VQQRTTTLKNVEEKDKDIHKNLAHYMQTTDRQDLDPKQLLDLELALLSRKPNKVDESEQPIEKNKKARATGRDKKRGFAKNKKEI
jgi:hypothetical protein